MTTKPNLILFDPHPRKIDLIFSKEDKNRLKTLGRTLWYEGQRAPDDFIEQHIADAVAIIGQTALPKERLDKAKQLKAVFNVEGNFLPNIDYEECHKRNIHVLACAPAFAPAVAEMALGLMLVCARGITQADGDFRLGTEKYSGASNTDSLLLRGKTFGLVGCGNVGRNLLPFLRPFGGEIAVYDPWIHPHVLKQMGVRAVSLGELFQISNVVFIISAATTENQNIIDETHFNFMSKGSIVLRVGRAEVVDFDSLLDAVESNQIKAAIDVFPEEPLPLEHRARKIPNLILSGHRSGGLPETYREVGRMVADDLELIVRGLPPQRMQRAVPEVISRYRSKSVG